MKYPFLVLDTETTGLGDDDEVLELGAVDPLGRKVFHCMVKPSRHTEWPEAQAVNKIAPEDVQFALTGDRLSPAVADLLSGAGFVVGYNIRFDLRMLRQSGFVLPEGLRACDVMDLVVERYGKRMSLGLAAADLGIKAEGAHSSIEDARTTLLVMGALSADRLGGIFEKAEEASSGDPEGKAPEGKEDPS